LLLLTTTLSPGVSLNAPWNAPAIRFSLPKNGHEAAEYLATPGAPRLAVLDWVMPVLDGPAVCRAIRTRPDKPYTYLILLTSKESKGDLVTGLELSH
jgi:CheY-like chemotaxis protein